MMNLDEILRGIGQQMSRSVPQWDSGSLTPQVQAPSASSYSMGPWGQAASSMFPEAPSGAGAFPELGGGFGSFQEMGGPGYFGFPERQQEALGHVAAAQQGAVSPAGQPSNDTAEQEAYIRQAAAQRHIDPDVAVNKVWANEGKGSYVGDNGSSFGPMQLHYGGVAGGGNSVGGLGDAFTQATGLDARDPSTWKAQVDWSLNYAAKNGWGPWHGHTGDPWEGIGSYNAPTQSMGGGAGTDQIMQKVQPFLGKGYVWGGKTPQSGFDCSGLAGWLTTGQPESTVTLYGKSTPVSEQSAQPGDLVFYNMNQGDMHLQHVAVYLGNGKIVQSGGTENTVNVGQAHQAVGSAPEFRRVGG